jgi:hypothetical protein
MLDSSLEGISRAIMKVGKQLMERRCSLVVAILIVGFSFGCDTDLSSHDATGGHQPDSNPEVHNTSMAVSADELNSGRQPSHASAPASVVVIDPDTGAISAPAKSPRGPAMQVADQENASISTSADDLVEEAVDAAPGGVKLDLQGRFQSAAKVRMLPDGEIVTECETRSTSVQE